MIERIFVQSLDEFNYTSSVNFYKKNETETGVVCMKGLEILFYNFDKIFVCDTSTRNLLLSSDICKKAETFNTIKNIANNISKSVYTQSDLDINKTHIYQYTFHALAKDMCEKIEPLYLPKKNDYFFVKEKLKNINKKIVTINGRNLEGDRAGRNNNLIETIKVLINSGYYVLNCTIPNPMLADNFDTESYAELLEEEIQDYSTYVSETNGSFSGLGSKINMRRR